MLFPDLILAMFVLRSATCDKSCALEPEPVLQGYVTRDDLFEVVG